MRPAGSTHAKVNVAMQDLTPFLHICAAGPKPRQSDTHESQDRSRAALERVTAAFSCGASALRLTGQTTTEAEFSPSQRRRRNVALQDLTPLPRSLERNLQRVKAWKAYGAEGPAGQQLQLA